MLAQLAAPVGFASRNGIYVPNGALALGRVSNTAGLSRTTNLPVITAFTMMAWVIFNTNAGGHFAGAFTFGAASGTDFYLFGTDTTDHLTLYNGSAVVSGSAIIPGVFYHVAFTVSGTGAGGALGYLNGVLDITADARAVTAAALWAGNSPDMDYVDGRLTAIKVWSRVLTPAEIVAELPYYLPVNPAGLNCCHPIALPPYGMVRGGGRFPDVSGYADRVWTENGTVDLASGPPIQWEQPPQQARVAMAPSAGGAVLEGIATVALTGSGALATGIPLAGAASVVLTGAGVLSTAIPLAGAAAVAVTATGTVTTAIALLGAATVAVTGAAGLTTAIPLLGVAALTLTGVGALSTQIPLAGAGSVVIIGSAGLNGSPAPLEGAAAVVLTGTGALNTAILLGGTGAVVLTGTGALSATILLGGAATVAITAAAALTTTLLPFAPSRFRVVASPESRRVTAAASGRRVVDD